MQGLLVFKQVNGRKISADTLGDRGQNPGFDGTAAATTQCKNRRQFVLCSVVDEIAIGHFQVVYNYSPPWRGDRTC